MLLIKEDTFLP